MDLHQLKQGKILIVGDIILDEYLQGTGKQGFARSSRSRAQT